MTTTGLNLTALADKSLRLLWEMNTFPSPRQRLGPLLMCRVVRILRGFESSTTLFRLAIFCFLFILWISQGSLPSLVNVYFLFCYSMFEVTLSLSCFFVFLSMSDIFLLCSNCIHVLVNLSLVDSVPFYW